MKILIISQYYPPETGALATRMSNLAKQLQTKGHDVIVLTEIPNYPSGVVTPKYRFKLFVKEKYNGIKVFRTFVCANPRKTNFQRMSFYLSFMFSATIAGLFLPKVDMVIATSPPLFVGVSGFVTSRLKGAKFILDIRDLWPESAVYLGELKAGKIANLAGRLEQYLYKKAEKITIAVPGFRGRLVDKGVPDSKIINFQNGVDTRHFQPCASHDELKNSFNMGNKFVVLFSGNHGLAQGLFTVLEAAQLLKEYKDIVFLFVGSGVDKDRLMSTAGNMQLGNVIFSPEKPHQQMPEIISMSDVCLVPLKNLQLFDNALPSKMFEYMACGKPILSTLTGEGRDLIMRSNSGLSVPPEDAPQMAKAVIKLYNDRALKASLGYNGLLYVREHFSREKMISLLESELLNFSYSFKQNSNK
ncbi:MAG TPA: glycosyltransferase family 4 protein [bacterium]|nr:glycosyltransferase family 4 protein [bacterium]HPN45815.1 glycosyltransferase family 4 protein [bacterium]